MSNRLDILIALTAHIEGVAPPDYTYTLAGRVHRGKPAFGIEKAGQQFVTILEPDDKLDLLPAPNHPDRRSQLWTLELFGVSGTPANANHPTDEAYVLLDDLRRRIAWINANTSTAGPGRVPRVLGGLVNGRIASGSGVVLPPDPQQARPTAVCVLPIDIPLAERIDP